MATDSDTAAHVPAPDGLPGGYPVRVGSAGPALDLPDGMSVAEAVTINEQCQRADGIEHIDEDGTVTYCEREMSIMKELLGYECRTMRLADTAEWAAELDDKYRKFAQRYL